MICLANLLALIACVNNPRASVEAFRVESVALDGLAVPFLSHKGPGAFDTYLAMNFLYEPMQRVERQIETRFRVELKNRGEAHLTIITPPEYTRLSAHFDIDEIETLVAGEIQSIPIAVTCLGRVRKQIVWAGDPSLQPHKAIADSYFLVVDSPHLADLRHRVAGAFRARGGEVEAFMPEAYQPHITIGFTHRDLHERDGAIKDQSACIAPVELTSR